MGIPENSPSKRLAAICEMDIAVSASVSENSSSLFVDFNSATVRSRVAKFTLTVVMNKKTMGMIEAKSK